MQKHKSGRKEDRLQVLVGLGNPGPEYKTTYHNAGRMFLERFIGTGAKMKQRPLFSYLRKGRLAIVLPKTFMNESGRAARAALSFFKTEPQDLILVHDDSDLPLGEFQISSGKGAAGHKGVASTIQELGGKDFTRIRIGIRSRAGKAGAFVLRPVSAEDLEKLYGVFDSISEQVTEKDTPCESA